MVIKITILAALLVFANTLFAQFDGKGEEEKSRFRPGTGWFFTGVRPAEIEKVHKYDRLIFDIAYNDWTGDLKSYMAKPSSIGFGVNFMADKPIAKGNTISIGYGLGYQRGHIRFDQSFYTNHQVGTTQYAETAQKQHSALNFNTFYIPLELRFRNESWKHLKIHLGGKIGYLTRLHENTKLKGQFGTTIIKDYQFPDVNQLQYAAHVRLGLRNLAFFGEYSFSNLFKNPASTQISIFRVGLSISLF
jgi:hypothetical protein